MYKRFTTLVLFGLMALPAAVTSVQAHTFCVDSAGDGPHGLQAALADASTGGMYNGEDNTINIVRGFYSTGDTGLVPFGYQSTDTHKLDINGGYNPDCSALVRNPALTILDGGTTTRVFDSSSAGDVSLRYLTFQNGKVGAFDDGAGLRMNLAPTGNGPVIVAYNIIRNNHAGGFNGGGFEIYTGGSSTIHFDNNLVVGNTTDGDDGGGRVRNSGSGATFVTNNTISQNSVTNAPAGTTGGALLDTADTTIVHISNNILWGNTGFDLDTAGVLVNNNVGSNFNAPAAGSSGNVSVDPQFLGSNDFRLAATSPLLAQGTTTPAGGLPSIDLVGHLRVYSNTVDTVDMGAYEHGNKIFDDSFDH